MILINWVVSIRHRKSLKLTLGTLFLAPPFSLPDKAEALLSSLGLVSLGDPVTFTDCASVGKAAEPDDRGYSSSDSVSTASTNLCYSSSR